jgi:hypothetical protein
MSGRLPTHVVVGSLLRRVNDAGGLAVVRARGDADAGGVLWVIDAPAGGRVLERGPTLDDCAAMVESHRLGDAESTEAYWRRRRARDPDLWVVELNIAEAERLVAETVATR